MSELEISLCRICLETSEDATDLFSPEKKSVYILEKLHECFHIVLNFEKHLPSLICCKCIEELDTAYNFRQKCLTFEERFLNLCNDTVMLNKQITLPDLQPKKENFSSNIEETSVFDDNHSIDPDNQAGVEKNMENYKCTICNKILKSKVSLLRHDISMHQKRKHLGKVTGYGASRLYHCTICTYCTPHSQTLVNHMRRHSGDRPYHCECGKRFTQSSSLAAHRKTHSNASYYTCATCGKQFKHAFTLKKHLQVHEAGKFSCEICHKNLKSRQSLQDHMHRHYNIKNYNCDDCGDTFVTCSELINHKKKHSLVKKIQCHLCGYKTNTKKSLVVHIKRHTGDKSYKCGLCELTFYTSGDLRRHHRVHTREKPFTCPMCAQRFTLSTSLNKHLHTVHGLDYKWGDLKFKDLKRTKRVQNKLQEYKKE